MNNLKQLTNKCTVFVFTQSFYNKKLRLLHVSIPVAIIIREYLHQITLYKTYLIQVQHLLELSNQNNTINALTSFIPHIRDMFRPS